MSEHVPQHHETHETPEQTHETLPSVEHSEKHRPAAEHRAEDIPSAEISGQRAKQEAKTRDEIPAPDAEGSASPQIVTGSINRELATMTRNRLLKHVRAHLSAPERTLSRFIHKPAIDQASELSGKTIARSSAMLGGGICAFVGSIVFLYISRHYGYAYNFLLFTAFFAGGMVIGLLVEGFIASLRRLRS